MAISLWGTLICRVSMVLRMITSPIDSDFLLLDFPWVPQTYRFGRFLWQIIWFLGGQTFIFPWFWGLMVVLCSEPSSYGCFQKKWYPKMDGLQWKTLLNGMIWGYHYFRKHPIWPKVQNNTQILNPESQNVRRFLSTTRLAPTENMIIASFTLQMRLEPDL